MLPSSPNAEEISILCGSVPLQADQHGPLPATGPEPAGPRHSRPLRLHTAPPQHCRRSRRRRRRRRWAEQPPPHAGQPGGAFHPGLPVGELLGASGHTGGAVRAPARAGPPVGAEGGAGEPVGSPGRGLICTLSTSRGKVMALT